MSDARAPATLGSEIKFLLPRHAAAHVLEWARAHLAPDPNGGGSFGDQYDVDTIYLDTGAFDTFQRRGSYARSKFRVRRYGRGALAYVERKMRTGTRLAKRRTGLPLAALAALAMDPAVQWFTDRVAVRGLAPVCQVSYTRVARVSGIGSDAVRLTVDADLRTLTSSALAFAEHDGERLLDEQIVVEVKYAQRPPALVRRFVEDFGLQPQRASKYRAAVEALGLAAAGPVRTAGSARA